jgi:hypothetical protein
MKTLLRLIELMLLFACMSCNHADILATDPAQAPAQAPTHPHDLLRLRAERAERAERERVLTPVQVKAQAEYKLRLKQAEQALDTSRLELMKQSELERLNAKKLTPDEARAMRLAHTKELNEHNRRCSSIEFKTEIKMAKEREEKWYRDHNIPMPKKNPQSVLLAADKYRPCDIPTEYSDKNDYPPGTVIHPSFMTKEMYSEPYIIKDDGYMYLYDRYDPSQNPYVPSHNP